MKTAFLLATPLLAIIAISASHADQTSGEQTKDYVRFMVTLSEYQLEGEIPASATEADILEFIRKTNTHPTETIRLTVISDIECMVKFGKRVKVTIGKSVNREVVTRQTQDLMIGTLLNLMLSRLADESVLAKLEFECSRLEGEGTDHSPPDIVSTNITTTQILDLGKPRLIGSTSSGKTSFVFITVTTLP